MARMNDRDEAHRLAGRSLDGDYGDEPYRLRLATIAEVHAILAVADAVEELTRAIRATCVTELSPIVTASPQGGPG